MANYNSAYTGAQIDTAVGKALNPQTTPTAGSASLITSGGVKSALDAAATKYDFQTTNVGDERNTLYAWDSSSIPSFSPEQTAGFLIYTVASGSYGVQMCLMINGNVYVRNRSFATWSAWKKLAFVT